MAEWEKIENNGMKNLKVRTKLLFGIGIIILMVILMGWLSYRQSSRMWENTDALYKHPFKVNIAIREIETNILKIRHGMTEVMLSGSQDEYHLIVRHLNENEALISRLLDTIYAQYLGDRRSIDTISVAIKDWNLVRQEAISLYQAGKIKEAVEITKGRESKAANTVLRKIIVIKDFSLNRAKEFYNSALKEKNDLATRSMVMLLLILGLSVVILITVMHSITLPLKEITMVTEQHRLGNYHAKSNLESTNEIGQLSAAINRMADSIRYDMSVKKNTAAILDAMLGQEQLMSFCQSVIGKLISVTDSNIGAIYLLNKENTTFEPYFSIGLSSDKIRSFSAVANEGEFGIALSSRVITRSTVIDDDTLFIYSAVTGNFKPREIITIPLLQFDKIIGMLSFASISNYSPEAIEVFNNSWNNLNAGISGILAFESIRSYAGQLDIQNERLVEQSTELQMQTDELIIQNTELEIQKRQIDEANQLKSQFLSSMSHELRTPLNSVIALSGVLIKRLKKLIPTEEYSFLEIIERNGKQLLMLINDVLDLSRIEAGKTQVQYSKLSLSDQVQSILSTMQTIIADKNILVKNNIGNDIPLVTTDSTKLYHILQNIIGNAIKFTETGSVEISARLDHEYVQIAIKDTGIGIPADQIPHIFEEFRQVDGTASRKTGGVGLGLSIADKYCQVIDASIEVESEPGKGSVFTVKIPVEPPYWASFKAANEADDLYYEKEPVVLNLEEMDGKGKKILVVEDNEPAIIQLSEILIEQGYQLEVTRNGQEALGSVTKNIPDAIILDLMMPGMDGFEVLEKIRGTKATEDIPILILTAKYLTKEELKRLSEKHVHQLVQKGDVRKNELLILVKGMINFNSFNKTNQRVERPRASVKTGRGTILLIDESAEAGITIKALLGDKHTVIEALDGTDGIICAKRMKPDLILLSVSISGKSGFQTLNEIRKEEALSDVPVIALTAMAMAGDREKIIAFGFDEYISKPIDATALDETIGKWISQ